MKKCNSCRRTLPINCFGVLVSNKDGYNPTCKECRNQYRRNAYHGHITNGENLLNLNSYNKIVFGKFTRKSEDMDFLGFSQDTKKKFFVEARLLDNGYQVSILDNESALVQAFNFYGDDPEFHLQVVVDFLEKNNIRLEYYRFENIRHFQCNIMSE